MKKGFTLIEVMIAITILAVALIPMMSMLTMGSRSYMKTQNTVKAYNLAVEGLEWMKSLDYLGYYWENRVNPSFQIFSHYSYDIGDRDSSFEPQEPQPIMNIYNGKVQTGDLDKDPGNNLLPAGFTAYYPYKSSENKIVMQKVDIFYPKEHFAVKNLAEFRRWGYFEILPGNNSAKITCVVSWLEGRFMHGKSDRIEKIYSVVVNNANVQQ